MNEIPTKSSFIGIAGNLQMGKDSIAEILSANLGWDRISFAQPIKQIVCDTFSVSMDFIEKWKVIKENPPGFDMTMRETLIMIGDGFRRVRGTVWIDKAFAELNAASIVSDVRYVNELKKIKERGGITILVWRPGYENNIKNESESQMRVLISYLSKMDIDGIVPDEVKNGPSAPLGVSLIDFFIRNNGDLADLKEKSEEVVETGRLFGWF